uniref:Uncharacterized protein n=1 Tax=Anguilla anguilla TaxID=7936 RepID=A0A0E9PVY6_ANGAN
MAKEILYLLLPDIQSQSEAPKKVSDCVWAHYLHLTKSVRRTDPPPLTSRTAASHMGSAHCTPCCAAGI